MCLVAAGHPFDLIKVRLQTLKTVAGQAPEFTGAVDAARKIVAREGVRAAEARSPARPTAPHALTPRSRARDRRCAAFTAGSRPRWWA